MDMPPRTGLEFLSMGYLQIFRSYGTLFQEQGVLHFAVLFDLSRTRRLDRDNCYCFRVGKSSILEKMKNKSTEAKKLDRNHPAFNKNAEPFFNIIMEGLKGELDVEHFWDAVAENAIFEFLYHIPGFTNRIEGRSAYMDWFGGYTNILHSADNLRVHKATQPDVIILEYEVHGVVPETQKAYDNRFCSIITIQERKIVHWRDYMDSLAVMLSLDPN